MAHRTQPAPSTSSGVRYVSPRGLSVQRTEGRRLASRLIRAAGDLAAEARSLGVSPDVVEHWADEHDPSAATLGDILAGRRDFAERVLTAALEHVREAEVPVPCPHRALSSVTRELGDVARALDDAGEERDEAEKARIRREIHETRARLSALERSL